MNSRAGLGALLVLLLAVQGAQADLKAELEAQLAQASTTRFSVLVIDERSGGVVFSHHPDRSLMPASNMKVVTSAAALSLLGPEFQHETRVLAAPAREGVVPGHLYVVGSGDPTISRRFDGEPLLADWAEALWEAGIRRIEGDVVADDRLFDRERLHPSWEDGDQERWFGAEIAALSLNDNCVDVSVSGSQGGVVVKARPDSSYVSFDVRATLIPGKRGHRFALLRTGDKRKIRVTGKVWRKASPYESSVPVPNPALFFATVLRDRLLARGIVVGGPARLVEAEEKAQGTAVYTRRAPLPRTLEVTNRNSQNFYAECLLKTLGAREGERGTWQEGALVLSEFLTRCGARGDGLRVVDGSGLSRDNRLTARALERVLREMSRGSHAELFRESLATPGEDGTLRKRFKGLPATLRAKTGTLRGASALSGYLSVGSRRLRFAAIGNGGSGSRIRRAIDALVRHLAQHYGA